jgi:tripartite-type tricarboxylate transporter receptor subunit TctC
VIKKISSLLIMLTMCVSASAKETITVYSPYSASHAGTTATRKVFDVANTAQNKYQFVLEFKAGAQGVLALKEIESNTTGKLAIIHAAFVDNVDKKMINESDYVPIHALGDACWAVVSIDGDPRLGVASLAGAREIVVGSVGFGNATHLTALQIGSRYNVPVRFVPFKSNYDSMMAMVGGHGVTFNLERVSVIEQFRDKNSNLKILAMSCPVRHPDAPTVKTLKEQGIVAPYVFNTIVAHQRMSRDRVRELGAILDKATLTVGVDEIRRLSDFRPAIFDRISAEEFTRSRTAMVKQLRQQHRQAIEESR